MGGADGYATNSIVEGTTVGTGKGRLGKHAPGYSGNSSLHTRCVDHRSKDLRAP